MLNETQPQVQAVKLRDSNLELYRIIVMFLIVAHHFVVNSNLVPIISADPLTPKSLFFYLFGAWGKTGINCFVMITGYFMCTSKITLKKFLKLVLQIEFYSFVISLCFLLAGSDSISTMDFLINLLPVRSVKDEFESCFILFWLAIPFLNILIKGLDKRGHLFLVFLSLFIYTGMTFVPHAGLSMNYVSWFIVLYFVSSFIRLYPESIYKHDSSVFWGIMTIVFILISMGGIVLVLWAIQRFSKPIDPYLFVSDSNHIFAVLIGVSSFLCFKNLKIKYNRFINMVAASTFGILLIHANRCDAMGDLIWNRIYSNEIIYNSPMFWLISFVKVAVVFISASVIDILRQRLLEKNFFRLIDDKLPLWEDAILRKISMKS